MLAKSTLSRATASEGRDAAVLPGQGRRPHFQVPRGACDTHCHVLGPVHRYPYAEDRHYTPEESDETVLRALHDRLGIDRTVIVQATVYGTDNRIVLDAIAEQPDARRGVALIDESVTDAALQALHEGGIRAARFGFIKKLWTPPDPDVFRRLMDRIAPLGWHVLVHVDATELPSLKTFFDDLPVPLLIDHMGRVDAAAGLAQPAFKQLLEWARRDNCWIKASALDRISATGGPFNDVVPFVRALMDTAPDRLLWGSDFPHPNPRHAVIDEADIIDLLPLCGDAAALQALLVDNPARLYGFSG